MFIHEHDLDVNLELHKFVLDVSELTIHVEIASRLVCSDLLDCVFDCIQAVVYAFIDFRHETFNILLRCLHGSTAHCRFHDDLLVNLTNLLVVLRVKVRVRILFLLSWWRGAENGTDRIGDIICLLAFLCLIL